MNDLRNAVVSSSSQFCKIVKESIQDAYFSAFRECCLPKGCEAVCTFRMYIAALRRDLRVRVFYRLQTYAFADIFLLFDVTRLL